MEPSHCPILWNARERRCVKQLWSQKPNGFDLAIMKEESGPFTYVRTSHILSHFSTLVANIACCIHFFLWATSCVEQTGETIPRCCLSLPPSTILAGFPSSLARCGTKKVEQFHSKRENNCLERNHKTKTKSLGMLIHSTVEKLKRVFWNWEKLLGT